MDYVNARTEDGAMTLCFDRGQEKVVHVYLESIQYKSNQICDSLDGKCKRILTLCVS